MNPDIKAKLRALGILDGKITSVELLRDTVKVTLAHPDGPVRLSIPRQDLGLGPASETAPPPWHQAGWAAANLKKYGSFAAVGSAFGLSAPELSSLRSYAYKELKWRQFEGVQVKRWEFLTLYFESPDPEQRPPLRELAAQLGLSVAVTHSYKASALQGQFFSKSFTHEKLGLLQLPDVSLDYFPVTGESLSAFALPNAEGWPDLPRGLLSDLLPGMSLQVDSVKASKGAVTFNLTHVESIRFTATFDGDLTFAPTAIQVTRDDDRGRLSFHLSNGDTMVECFGVVQRVLEASAGADYALGESRM